MRKRLRFLIVAVAACIFANALTITTSRADEYAATQPTTQSAAWFRMSPDEFARSEAAAREFPWENIDDRLLSAAVLHETNRHRAEHKLTALRHMPKLDDAAIMHAVDMAAGGWFAHEHPSDPKKRLVIDRVKLLKLRPMFVGENIIMEYGLRYDPKREVFEVTRDGQRTLSYEPDGPPIARHTYHTFAKQIVQRWMDSPPHRENILSPHARFLGSAARPGAKEEEVKFQKYYCVQVFFAPMR